MNRSESIENLATALHKAQSEMGGVVKDSKNPFFKSSYADLTAVIKAIKEPFEKHGLSYLQFPCSDGDKVGVRTVLMHVSGEYIEDSFTLSLTKLDPQQAGSAITYARRYALQSIAGLPAVDDDAESAMVRGKITSGQVSSITSLLKTEELEKAFFEKSGVKAVEDLPPQRYAAAMKWLREASSAA